MNILAIASSYPKFRFDSTAPFIESITRELAGRGHRITMVLPHRRDLEPIPIDGVRFVSYHYAPHSSLGVFGYAEALKADVSIKRSTYLVAPLAVAAGARALWRLAKRERYDVLHAHWVVPNGAMAWPAASRFGLPLALSLHGSDVFVAEKRRVFKSAARLAFGQAKTVTACSDDLADRSMALGARARPTTVPYGVDCERFGPAADDPSRLSALRQRFGWRIDESIVLAVGRLVHKKGFEYLIDAMSLSKTNGERDLPRLVIAGSGDLESWLRERAKRCSLNERLQLIGNIERAELPALFRLASVVAVPSVVDAAGNVDGLPNVLLESMASGAAIVASRVAGIPQAIEDKTSGVLVPEKDPQALAEAIEALLADPEARRRLGEAARARAQTSFSWSRVGERFESLLGAVARASSAPG